MIRLAAVAVLALGLAGCEALAPMAGALSGTVMGEFAANSDAMVAEKTRLNMAKDRGMTACLDQVDRLVRTDTDPANVAAGYVGCFDILAIERTEGVWGGLTGFFKENPAP